MRKYTLATRVNCKNRLQGRNVMMLYLWVLGFQCKPWSLDEVWTELMRLVLSVVLGGFTKPELTVSHDLGSTSFHIFIFFSFFFIRKYFLILFLVSNIKLYYRAMFLIIIIGVLGHRWDKAITYGLNLYILWINVMVPFIFSLSLLLISLRKRPTSSLFEELSTV